MSIRNLVNLVNTTMPYAWDDSLTVYEMIGKLIRTINEMVDFINDELADKITAAIADELVDFTSDQILVLMQTGELAQMILDYVDQIAGPVLDIEGRQPYNIGKDAPTGDITSYLNTLINTLGPNGVIYIPKGIWNIAGQVNMLEGTVIKGDRKSSIINITNAGSFRKRYRSEIMDLTFQVAEHYDGTLFKIDSFGLDSYDKQRIDAGLYRIDAYKPYNSDYKATFLDLYAKVQAGELLSGFYNFTADDINVSGFAVPLSLRIMDGWLHANTFSNWRVDYFEKAIVMDGQKSPTGDDSRIRRNRFLDWTIQPRENITIEFFETNRYFINDFKGLDLWDIYRADWNSRWPIGDIDSSEWYTSNSAPATFSKYGENFFPTRVYPIGVTLDKTAQGRMRLHYYGSSDNTAVIDILDGSVTIRGSKSFTNPFKFYRDPNGVIWMEVIAASTATGAIYYGERKNMGTLPLHYYDSIADTKLPSGLVACTETTKDIVDGVLSRYTTFLSGFTGWVETYQVGKMICVEGVVDGTAATASTALKLPDAKNPGWGSSAVQGYAITASSFLALPMGAVNTFRFTYIAL